VFEKLVQVTFVGKAQFMRDFIDTLVAVPEAVLDQRRFVIADVAL
jgi:hypothetical protein